MRMFSLRVRCFSPWCVVSSIVVLVLIVVGPGSSIVSAAGPGQPWAVIQNGSGTGQAAWSLRNGGLVPGPFQGPMAMAADPAGNVWIADTLNARLLVLSDRGRLTKTIDLQPVQKSAGLAQPPLISDITFPGDESLALADEANTTILILDLNGRFLRRFSGPGGRPEDLLQINRLHADREGRVYVEETARNRIAVFSPAGEWLSELKGLSGVAVRADGRVLQPVYEGNPRERTLEWYDLSGSKIGVLCRFAETEDIRFIQPLGFDKAGNLILLYDTAKERVIRRIAADGTVNSELRSTFFDSGLELTTPWWIAPDGSVSWIEVTARQATIRRMTFP